jgi:hypothetical protein
MNSVIDLFDISAARRKSASCRGVARNPRRAERVAVVMARLSETALMFVHRAYSGNRCGDRASSLGMEELARQAQELRLGYE